MNEKFPLIDLPRTLRAHHDIGVSYAAVWRAVVDGRIPADRQGRRWWIDTADLPNIAAHFTATA